MYNCVCVVGLSEVSGFIFWEPVSKKKQNDKTYKIRIRNVKTHFPKKLVVDRNSGFGFGQNWTFGELSVSAKIVLLVHRK